MPKSASRNNLVSVVIVNWNGLEDTKLCLEHTRKQTYRNIEIIIVDNGSTDGSVDYLRTVKDIKLVENPQNLGFTGGHIAGYKASRGDFILLLNNDAIMDSRYIENAVISMRSDKKIGAIGGRAYLWDETNPLFDTTNQFYAYQIIHPINAEGIFPQSDEGYPQEVNAVSGSCVMVRRSVIERIGYLHAPFFAYFEESDLFARMKRAGYKIIYNPDLAIWHANSKTSNRKGSTFSYYMLMRNRYRFAVRNFDAWSLRRFLKFYIRLGLVCIIKLPIPGEMQPIRKAYTKAFLYNLACGWLPFVERRQLKKQLGPSDYNQLIFTEQNRFSIVTSAKSQKSVDYCIRVARNLKVGDEMLVCTKDDSLVNQLKKLSSELPALRLCLDRGFFNTHSENLGIVCAKNERIIVVSPNDLSDGQILESVPKAIYSMYKRGKGAAFFSNSDKSISADGILATNASPLTIFHRSLLIEVSGIHREMGLSDAIRTLLAYAAVSKTLLRIPKTGNSNSLPSYSSQVMKRSELIGFVKAKFHEAQLQKNRPDIFTAHFADKLSFRLSQLRILGSWYLSGKITTYLKLARTKNLVLATATLRRRKLAIELAHIKNELIGSEFRVDLKELKKKEHQRLAYLKDNPQDTTVFIVTRDRLAHLNQLLSWLESQGLNRVVFVDNDSILPPLVDLFDNTEYQVLELARNVGHRCVWSAGVIRLLLPDDFYVVTDPDIVPATNQKNVLGHLYDIHSKYPDHLKVGLGLKIDDLPEHYTLKQDVIKWETQFWSQPLEDGVYESGVDTTFALYKPYTYEYFIHPSLRTGEPYTAKHLPWYADSAKLTAEDVFYRMRADQNVNTWDKEHLPERYKKELAKHHR